VASELKGLAQIADRYAAALFELADEERSLEAVAEDLRRLRAMLETSDELRRLVRSPVLTRAQQGKAVLALAGSAGLKPTTRNLLGLLARNRRLFALAAVIDSYLSKLAARRGEITASVVSAQPLSSAQREGLTEQLRRTYGAKVAVDVKVDPALLGGLVVKVGSRMVDASLRSKLHRLQLAMKGV
jgi:F-type H+-transporting ATPase subunit delta